MKKQLALLVTLFACSQLAANNINWSTPPTTLSTTSVNASDPRVAIDGSGDAFAIWVENNVVKTATQPANMSWGSPTTLSATGASSPRIVADSNGNATAVWVLNGVIQVASKPSNGNWSNATSLSSAGASSPTIAVDSAGDVMVAWVSGNNVQVSTKLFGGNWSTKVNIGSSSPTTPFIAMGGTGSSTRGVIVWHGVGSGKNNVYFSSKPVSSGSWSSAAQISDSAQNADLPKVTVDAGGTATAVWYAYNVSGTNFSAVTLQSSSQVSGGSWTSPVVLSNQGIMNPDNLYATVNVDNNGNVIALWNNSYDGETFNVESALKPLAGSWTSPTVLVAGNPYAYQAKMAVSSLGDALAVYMYYNGTALLLQSVESNTTGFLENSWSVPINVSMGSTNGFPSVAATLSGSTLNAVAVWVNNNGSHNIINAARGTRSIVAPATGLSASQSVNNFGIFSEYQNTLSWTASTNPNVVGYLIFRNGVLFQQVDSSTLQIVDHNAVQSQTVTYGVAAIDNQNSQSAIVTTTLF